MVAISIIPEIAGCEEIATGDTQKNL